MKRSFGNYDLGEVTVSLDETNATLSLRWPFDRESDEWIRATASFGKGAVAQAFHVGNDTLAVAENHQALTLTFLDGSEFKLNLRGRNAIGPVEADLRVPASVAEPLLQTLREWSSA